MINKIGVLTSGGDSPSMNAAIRSVTRYAIYKGLTVEGIQRGYEGLIHGESLALNRRSVGGIIHRGGTHLRTSRSEEFMTQEGRLKGYNWLVQNHIDAIVVIGGNGSMKGAEKLSEMGLPTVTIPGTIDNDMAGTQYTLGYDTAVNTVLEAVNRIRDTAVSHDRVAIIEVMGRHAGFIALESGLSCGAEIVLIPEKKMSMEEVSHHWKNPISSGKEQHHHYGRRRCERSRCSPVYEGTSSGNESEPDRVRLSPARGCTQCPRCEDGQPLWTEGRRISAVWRHGGRRRSYPR